MERIGRRAERFVDDEREELIAELEEKARKIRVHVARMRTAIRVVHCL